MTRTPAQKRALARADKFLRVTGNYDRGDLQTTVSDALADLMHYAHANKLDFEAALGSAEKHFHAEAIEPDDLAMDDF